MPKPCLSCPFEFSPEADLANNSGCLPSATDIVALKQTTGHNWACHSNCNRVCQGLAEAVVRRQLDVDMSQGQLVHDFVSAHARQQWRGAPGESLDFYDLTLPGDAYGS